MLYRQLYLNLLVNCDIKGILRYSKTGDVDSFPAQTTHQDRIFTQQRMTTVAPFKSTVIRHTGRTLATTRVKANIANSGSMQGTG